MQVRHDQLGKGGVPYIATHDGRTIRYVDPDVKARPPTAYQFCLSIVHCLVARCTRFLM